MILQLNTLLSIIGGILGVALLLSIVVVGFRENSKTHGKGSGKIKSKNENDTKM